ncbi:MAG: Flp family type IVb pilin [Planctomycetota bacterium]|jgi:Flp pilus assembly pilin Flp
MDRFKTSLTRLWRDERGAEGLEKLLIIAAIVLPLLGVLFLFRDWLVDWLGDEANEVRMESENTVDPFN